MDQLNLFEEILPHRYAVIFCSCIMKDQFGDIWERKEIISSGLSKDVAENYARLKNSKVFSGKSDYYKVVEMININFLLD